MSWTVKKPEHPERAQRHEKNMQIPQERPQSGFKTRNF